MVLFIDLYAHTLFNIYIMCILAEERSILLPNFLNNYFKLPSVSQGGIDN